MPFDHIFGQDQAIKFLSQSLQAGRVAHAYLFVGPEGVGKERTAITLAQALNCQEGGSNPCGVCQSCRRIWEGKYPDVKVIAPDGKTIKIAQIRAVQGEAYYRPLEGRYKVYIFSDAHKMTEAAANSFLRVLEEPPAHVVFILVTFQGAALLPTIISRCQVVNFFPFSLNLIMERLERERGLAREDAARVAVLAGGSWGKALTLAQKDLPRVVGEQILEIADIFCRGEEARRWQLAAQLEAGELDLLLDQILYWFRDLLILKETGALDLLLNRDQAPKLEEMARLYSREDLLEALESIHDTRRFVGESINTRLALDVLVGKLEPSSSHG